MAKKKEKKVETKEETKDVVEYTENITDDEYAVTVDYTIDDEHPMETEVVQREVEEEE